MECVKERSKSSFNEDGKMEFKNKTKTRKDRLFSVLRKKNTISFHEGLMNSVSKMGWESRENL